jgi:hypothetical protein
MPLEIIETLKKIHSQLDAIETEFLAIADARTENVQNIIDVYVCRQVSNYNKYLLFLTQKLNDDIENSQMYLLQLRTLVDIFCSISYILSLDKLEAARIIFCEDLIVLKKFIPDSFESIFIEYTSAQPKLFDTLESFPKDYSTFSKSRLRKIAEIDKITLFFPETFESKLTKAVPFILKNTMYLKRSINFNIPESLLHTWNSFSCHVHGSHFFKDKFGKEHFWIASKSILGSFAFMELLERSLLYREDSKNLNLLLKDIKLSLDTLIKFQ